MGWGVPCYIFCTSSVEGCWALKSPLQLGPACMQVYRVCGLIINWLSCLSLLWRPPSASFLFPLSSSRSAQLGGRIMTLLSISCSWFSEDVGPLRRLICQQPPHRWSRPTCGDQRGSPEKMGSLDSSHHTVGWSRPPALNEECGRCLHRSPLPTCE